MDYENDLIHLKVPSNWTVDRSKFNDELISLKPVYSNYPVIYIHKSEIEPTEIIGSYINNYPVEYPYFQVVSREKVKVNGQEGEKLVFKNTASDDFLLIGPYFYSAVIVFKKNNQTYIISSSEAMEHTYYSQVEPTLKVLLNSIQIKPN